MRGSASEPQAQASGHQNQVLTPRRSFRGPKNQPLTLRTTFWTSRIRFWPQEVASRPRNPPSGPHRKRKPGFFKCLATSARSAQTHQVGNKT